MIVSSPERMLEMRKIGTLEGILIMKIEIVLLDFMNLNNTAWPVPLDFLGNPPPSLLHPILVKYENAGWTLKFEHDKIWFCLN